MTQEFCIFQLLHWVYSPGDIAVSQKKWIWSHQAASKAEKPEEIHGHGEREKTQKKMQRTGKDGGGLFTVAFPRKAG